MNTHSQRFHNKISQSNRKSLFTWEKIGSKFIKSRNMLMTLCRHKVTKQVKMCRFSTTLIENVAFAIFTRYEKFYSRNWYHKATAPISTVLFTLFPISWRNVVELIKNWDDRNQSAKSFQMRHYLSKLNNQNYQTSIDDGNATHKIKNPPGLAK